MNTDKEQVSWLTTLFTGWGIRESWAKIIAGAIVGALVAAGVLSTGACTPATTEQSQQWSRIHEAYHLISGTPCAEEEGPEYQ